MVHGCLVTFILHVDSDLCLASSVRKYIEAIVLKPNPILKSSRLFPLAAFLTRKSRRTIKIRKTAKRSTETASTDKKYINVPKK